MTYEPRPPPAGRRPSTRATLLAGLLLACAGMAAVVHLTLQSSTFLSEFHTKPALSSTEHTLRDRAAPVLSSTLRAAVVAGAASGGAGGDKNNKGYVQVLANNLFAKTMKTLSPAPGSVQSNSLGHELAGISEPGSRDDGRAPAALPPPSPTQFTAGMHLAPAVGSTAAPAAAAGGMTGLTEVDKVLGHAMGGANPDSPTESARTHHSLFAHSLDTPSTLKFKEYEFGGGGHLSPFEATAVTPLITGSSAEEVAQNAEVLSKPIYPDMAIALANVVDVDEMGVLGISESERSLQNDEEMMREESLIDDGDEEDDEEGQVDDDSRRR